MLKAIQNDMVTGQYGLAFRILEALILLPSIIVAAVLPRLSTLFHDQINPPFASLLKKSIGLLAPISCLIALVLTLMAPFVISILEPGPDAVPASRALQLLVWTFPFAGVNYLFSTALTAADDQVALAWILGVAALLNIGLNSLLIPFYSLYGACIATLITQLSITLAMILRYRRLQYGTPTQISTDRIRLD